MTAIYKRPASPGQFIENLPPADKEIFSEIKRFTEWYEGSSEFRDLCRDGAISTEWIDRLSSLGVREEVIESMSSVQNANNPTHPILLKLSEISVDPKELYNDIDRLESSIYLRLYFKYTILKAISQREHHDWSLNKLSGESPYFAWRKRRIKAVRSELGWYGHGIDHPTFSIELGVGCTVGCTFCAFDAQKHETNFDFNKSGNVELFRAVAGAFKTVMGDGCGGGMLYYATEPNDNPNYIDFLDEYYKVTGYKLCTSTARYDLDWLQRLKDFYSTPYPQPWPRVSVLSKHCMEKIHRHFAPIDFIYPWLLAQSIEMEDERQKVPGGREKFGMKKLQEVRDARAYHSPEDVDYSTIPQGSIACVTGFKVNMVNKTITATSPCYTSQKWSHGYREYGTVSFTGPETVLPALEKLISIAMLPSPSIDMKYAWRDDLDCRLLPDGFQLVSPYNFHEFTGNPLYISLGRILSDCHGFTFMEVRDILLKEVPDSDVFTVTELLRRFFNAGFIDENNIASEHLENLNSQLISA